MNLPFSWKKPSRELHPGPPFNQTVISSTGLPIVGWNTKNSCLEVSFISIGMLPLYISPKSNGKSGSDSTKLALRQLANLRRTRDTNDCTYGPCGRRKNDTRMFCHSDERRHLCGGAQILYALFPFCQSSTCSICRCWAGRRGCHQARCLQPRVYEETKIGAAS